MALSTQAGIVAALPGQRPYIYKTGQTGRTPLSYWFQAGTPGVGATPAGKASGGSVPTKSTAGALQYRDADAGNQLYVYSFEAVMNSLIAVWLADRVYACDGFVANVGTAQTITSPVALTRPDANGFDVEMWIEINTSVGTGPYTVTVSYTDPNNGAGRTAVGVIATNAGLNQGNMIPCSLQAGDTGVSSIQSLTLATAGGTAGDFAMVLLRRIAVTAITATQKPSLLDPLGAMLAKVPNNACLFMFTENGVAGSSTNGIIVAQLQLIEG